MFTAALVTIAKTWKQPKCPSVDKWIKKMWYTHKMEYHSALKEKEVPPFAITGMKLEDIMLREKSSNRETCMISLTWRF